VTNISPAATLAAPPTDAGLVRGITTFPLAASIVNSVVGVSIFTLPAVVALEAGAAAPVAYLLTAIVMAGVTICFAEAGSRVPTSGGVYGSVAAALGPAAAFVVGILFLVSNALASGGIAAALADTLASLDPVLSTEAGRLAIILAAYAVLAWINLAGVKTTARLITVASLLKLAPLLLFLILGLISLNTAAPTGPPPPPTTVAGFGRGLILTLFAFEGMEIALGASGEVHHPCRTLPRALFLAMFVVLAIYLGVQLSAQHLLGGNLAHATAPLAEAASHFGWQMEALMLCGAVLSMLGYMAGDILGTSRMVFALARDASLPRRLGDVRHASGVPANAVLAYVAVAFILAATGSFLELVVLSALATVAIYILVCAAAVVLWRRKIALAGAPLGFPALPVAALVGLAGMAGMLISARWQEIAGLLALIGASLVVYAAGRRTRRHIRAAAPETNQ
jgi:amino acid transporter